MKMINIGLKIIYLKGLGMMLVSIAIDGEESWPQFTVNMKQTTWQLESRIQELGLGGLPTKTENGNGLMDLRGTMQIGELVIQKIPVC